VQENAPTLVGALTVNSSVSLKSSRYSTSSAVATNASPAITSMRPPRRLRAASNTLTCKTTAAPTGTSGGIGRASSKRIERDRGLTPPRLGGAGGGRIGAPALTTVAQPHGSRRCGRTLLLGRCHVGRTRRRNRRTHRGLG